MRHPKPILLTLALFLFATSLILISSSRRYRFHNFLSYATRPIWDTPDGPTILVPHYYYEGMSMDEQACSLHGWTPRSRSTTYEHSDDAGVVVLDAVLMSSELDLLEIRMHELDAVVDRFFIVESNTTFTGLPKETHFANERDRFREFTHKIEYHFLPGFPHDEGEDAWIIEARARDYMTSHLQNFIRTLPPSVIPLIVMSDVDEIPSRHSIELLVACDFGQSIHLRLRNYIYSFEWLLGLDASWRASVHAYPPGEGVEIRYRHSLSSDTALSDAGWHCSFCFRTLAEFVTKMRGFSHADRIGGDMQLVDESHIQEAICRGEDVFGMLPEAYSYGDLLSQYYIKASGSVIDIPRHIIRNRDSYRYLLPGGCNRSSRLL